MATIVPADLHLWLSVNDGPGHSAPQFNPNESLGGFVATSPLESAQVHALFDTVTGVENAAGQIDYRCFFVHNAHASRSWTSVKVWLSAEVSGGCTAAIALDGTGIKTLTSVTAQSEVIANDLTAPSGESFSAPTTKGAGLSIGTLTPGDVQAVWVRRTAVDSLSKFADGVTIRVEGDTLEA